MHFSCNCVISKREILMRNSLFIQLSKITIIFVFQYFLSQSTSSQCCYSSRGKTSRWFLRMFSWLSNHKIVNFCGIPKLRPIFISPIELFMPCTIFWVGVETLYFQLSFVATFFFKSSEFLSLLSITCYIPTEKKCSVQDWLHIIIWITYKR